jgi:phenylalanyl-tRNA synthetase beta chain
VWERSTKVQTLTTLDGTTLELKKNKELVVSDNLGPLVLASAVGGRRSAISDRTVSVLGEVAVYNSAKMKSDARGLGVTTEASTRLEKELSAEDVAWALSFLGQALVKYAGGTVNSALFDYYPAPSRKPGAKITLGADLSARYGGVTISLAETERLLKRYGFTVSRKTSDSLQVVAPSWRPDVTTVADVAEEVLRLYGFQNIKPIPPALRPVADVTPKNITLSRLLETGLSGAGFDEVLSLPLTTTEWNRKTALQDLEEIRTQNAINEEVPVLRQSLAGGLLNQQHEFIRRGVTHVQLFEIGKVFGKQGRKIVELERCGLLVQSESAQYAVSQMYDAVQTQLRQLGAVRIGFDTLSRVPALANPHAAWNITIGTKIVGWMYQVQPLELSGNRTVGGTVYAELDYEQIVLAIPGEHPRPAQELLTKLVVLDGNVETENREEFEANVVKITRTIGRPQLWSLEVVDGFALGSGRTRYTLRVTYQNLTDNQAKALHEQAFASNKT